MTDSPKLSRNLAELPGDGLRLSGLAVQRLEALHREAAGIEALDELCAMLDPGRRLGRNRLAGLIEGHLRRFEVTTYPRIARGGRPVRNPGEALLLAIVESSLPRSQRRIVDLIG